LIKVNFKVCCVYFFSCKLTFSVIFQKKNAASAATFKTFVKNAASAATFKFWGVYVLGHIFFGRSWGGGSLLYGKGPALGPPVFSSSRLIYIQWRFYSNFDPLICIVCLFCLDFSTIFWHFCFIVWTYAIKHSRLKNKARSVNLPSFPQNTVLWGKWQPWWYDSRTENIIFSVYFILFFYNTKFFFFFKILFFFLWKNF